MKKIKEKEVSNNNNKKIKRKRVNDLKIIFKLIKDNKFYVIDLINF